MIARVTGTLVDLSEDRAVVAVEDGGADRHGVAYEVLLPHSLIAVLHGQRNATVTLYIYNYLEGGMMGSHLLPRLVGFATPFEREFFERFITVQNVGPRKALRALVRPVAEIAGAIEAGNVGFLSQLPGIGKRTAEKIVAELKGKVGKYALVQSPAETPVETREPTLAEEAMEVLGQLGYKPGEAEAMIQNVLAAKPDIADVEVLIQEVYARAAPR